MFKLFLNAYGYEVYTAESGEKGLDLFLKIHPEIVFTDIKMPGIDGIEVLKRIRQTEIQTEVIIITGHGDMEKAVEALDLDASDFINKPVERKALNSALSRAEKRLQVSDPNGFKAERTMENNSLVVSIKGKLTGVTGKVLFKMLSWDDTDTVNIDSARLVFDENFSINRTGIALLIDFIQKLNKKKCHVYLENLCYNYIKFFQMAGISKTAEITA